MANEANASNSTEKKISKIEMVRRAIKLGKKRKPAEIQKWVLEKFGETIGLTHISTIKSNLKKYKVKKPAATGEATETAPTPRRKSEPEAAPSLSFEEMRVVKELVERMGQERVKEAVDLLG